MRGMDPVVLASPCEIGCSAGCDHGLSRRATFIHAAAADVGLFYEGGAVACFGEGAGEGGSALAGTDYYGVVFCCHCSGVMVIGGGK